MSVACRGIYHSLYSNGSISIEHGEITSLDSLTNSVMKTMIYKRRKLNTQRHSVKFIKNCNSTPIKLVVNIIPIESTFSSNFVHSVNRQSSTKLNCTTRQAEIWEAPPSWKDYPYCNQHFFHIELKSNYLFS
jgi:hypothetical protein